MNLERRVGIEGQRTREFGSFLGRCIRFSKIGPPGPIIGWGPIRGPIVGRFCSPHGFGVSEGFSATGGTPLFFPPG